MVLLIGLSIVLLIALSASCMKKKVVAPTLYVHQAAPVIHHNISTTDDGRRLRNDTNIVKLPPVLVSLPDHFILLQEPTQNAPYAFDDAHIPINPENLDDLTGVEVNITARSKRYQNSVCYFGILHSDGVS